MSDHEIDQLMTERDNAEEAMSQAYYLVVGESPEWSNLFGYKEALEAIDEAQHTLRTELAAKDKRIEAISELVDAVEGVQDWSGTRVGDALAALTPPAKCEGESNGKD